MRHESAQRALLAGLVAASTVALASGGEAPLNLTTAAAQHGAASSDPALAGIWKAVSPRDGSMHGEFDSNDPIGLAAGVRIPADCSLNWVDPDFGQRYCFSSATSLVYFLNSPRAFLARARKTWSALNGEHH
jgi:hypothetical protein